MKGSPVTKAQEEAEVVTSGRRNNPLTTFDRANACPPQKIRLQQIAVELLTRNMRESYPER